MTETTDTQNAARADELEEPVAPAADETFAWTKDPEDEASTGAAGVLESLREAVDDLAERAGPVVRDISVRAAELTSAAAAKAAPLVKKAGEATADASAKLAERSRTWADEHRPGDPERTGPEEAATAVAEAAEEAVDEAVETTKPDEG